MSRNKPSFYIGKIIYSRFPYFNVKTNKKSYKSRPVLIIGTEREAYPCDFNVFPVSKISNKRYLDDNYDIELNAADCKKLNLTEIPSFIRVHKQSVISSNDMSKNILNDLSEVCPDIYETIKEKHSEYSETLF